GGLVLLEAESGGGKTRLLHEFAYQSAQKGAWILFGQGIDQAAQRPFQLIEGVATTFVSAAGSDADAAASIVQKLGEHREAVCDSLPVLSQALGPGTPGGLGPEAFGEARSLNALAAFLDS